MHVETESGDRMERYLLRFPLALGNTPESEKKEILSDIRCHIADRIAESELPAEQALAQTLEALGTPESLAQTYRAEGLLSRAATASSPWVLIRATFVWALAGIEGFFALSALFLGYAAALSFLACAVLKPIFPDRVGMWVDPPIFTFGILTSQHQAHELLGYWIVPIGLIVGSSLLVLTTRCGRWLIRRFAGNSKWVLPRRLAQTVQRSSSINS